MTKKKTPTPVKKAVPKKKVSYPKWIQTAQTQIDARLSPIIPPAGETRIGELEAENYALKTLLSKQDSVFSAGKKAKEIALEAAIRSKPNDYTYGTNLQGQQVKLPLHFDVLAEAEKIYQWLIK